MSEASSGFAVLGSSTGSSGGAAFTVVVAGLPRSGTSMVAGCLERLGVAMGAGDSPTAEDPEFVRLLDRQRARGEPFSPTSPDFPALEALIARRNADGERWGWKFPGLQFREILEHLRAPRVVCVHRDLVAIASRTAASEGEELLDAYGRLGAMQRDLEAWVATAREPRLLVSYEKALLDPEGFVRVLSAFVGSDDEECLEAASRFVTPSPRAYRQATRAVAIHGNLDGIFDDRIVGWAARLEDPRQPVEVELFVDGHAAGRTSTGAARPDVARHLAALLGTDEQRVGESHGFALDLPARLRDGRDHEVSVQVVGESDFRIGDSPRRLSFPT